MQFSYPPVYLPSVLRARESSSATKFGAQGDERITQAEIEKISGVVLADQYTIWGASNPKIVRR